MLGGVYTEEQIRAAAELGTYEVEAELVEAGGYWVVEIDGIVVAGSGWSGGGSMRPDVGLGGCG